MDIINALGRRKSSVARVYLSKGKGKMTIKATTMDMEFPVKVEVRDGSMHVTGDIVVDRSKFDVKYPSVGDYAAKNDLKLKLDITAKI